MRSQPARRAKSVLVDCVRHARPRLSATLAGGALALTSGSATAESRRPIDEGWPSDWVRIGPGEGTGVAAAAAIAIALQFALHPSTDHWHDGILFDGDVRGPLRPSSAQARSRAATASDLGYFGLPLYQVLVEAGLVTWLGHRQPDAAAQLALLDIEAIAVNGLLTTVLQKSTARARPSLQGCAASSTSSDCLSSMHNESFPSGHTSVAFTVAASLCVQHSRLALLGRADPFVCPAALAVATATGVLRVVADRHWSTDVIAGAALGSAVGTIVSLAHLRSRPDSLLGRFTTRLASRSAEVLYVSSF